jgi:hypothetical protein
MHRTSEGQAEPSCAACDVWGTDMMDEEQLAQLLESYLTVNLVRGLIWAMYCIWCKEYYGTGAGLVDHRGSARKHPLYLLYKETEFTRLCVSRAITKKLGDRAWMRILNPMGPSDLICQATRDRP